MRGTDAGAERAGEVRVGRTVALYGTLVLALPFVIDLGIPSALFFILWLGGSFAAGLFAPWRVMALTSGGALAIGTIVLVLGLVDTEFFSDALSFVALAMLTLGELAGLAAGSVVARGNRLRTR